MNPYLLCYALYAAAIAPVTLRFSLRLGRRAGFGLRLQLAGLPFLRKRSPKDRAGERPLRRREVAQTLGGADYALVTAAVNTLRGWRPRGFVRLVELELYARFAFADACANALGYAAAREILRALSACLRPACRVSGHVEADFGGGGAEALVRGIVSARLGSLALVAILLAARYLRARAGLQTAKEEGYAASH